MTTISETIMELVQQADDNGQDPIQAVLDYMLEKDSRITRIEASRLVDQARETLTRKTAGGAAKLRLLEALVDHERITGQIYSISTEDVEAFLNERPALAAMLDGLDPEVLASAIFDAIGEIGIIELVEDAIRETILVSAIQPAGPDRDDPMDGDAASALASAGMGTDEDYGCFGDDCEDW